MSLQDITITGSIKSIASQSYGQRTYVSSTDEQSFPIETITGSQAGVWPNFIPDTNYTTDLVVNITQSWSKSIITPLGIVNTTHETMKEFIDGEFSGSNYTVSNGDLTDEDCQQFLVANDKAFRYSIFPYASQSLYPFNHTNTIPGNGEILIYYVDIDYPIENVMYAKISRIDKDGNDLTNTLSQLTVGNYIEWIDASIGLVKLEIENRTDNATYFLFKFKSNLITTPGFFDDNYLDYKFLATQSLNYVVTSSTNGTFLYFKNGTWTITTDSASGWNNSTKQYFFPLSPNTQITFTASISMSVNYPVSFSWGIQAWQPSTNEIIDGIPSTVPVWNESNYISLPAGAQTLVISSSIYQPIQGYAYEIDGVLKGNYLFPYWSNEYLIGTGSQGDFGGNGDQYDNVPYPYKSWYSIGSNTFQRDPAGTYTFFSNVNKGGNPPDGYQLYGTSPGQGVYLWNTTRPSLNNKDCLLTWWTSSAGGTQTANEYNIFNASDVGKTIKVSVEIPSPYPGYPGGPITNPGILNDIQNNYGGGIFGPSSGSNIRVVTTTVGSNSGGGTIATQSLIGIIPSQSSGLFEFDYTIQSGDRKIGIYAPAGASDEYAGVGLGWQFAVSRFIVATPVSASFNNLKWSITQSNFPTTSTSSFIFEPYFPSAFYNTDCDVTMNNYSQNDISTMYQEVLYDNGGIIPSNLQQIISGTAQYAEINDYLYSANANVLPRYKGVRSESPGFNQPSTYNGYGTLPNVESTTTYFAYFDNLKANWPIFKNTTSPIIKYLIREDGEVINPSLDEATYYNTIDSFPQGTKAYANLLDNDTIAFSTTQSILLSGYSYTPIMYNINNSNEISATFTSTMSFNNLQGNVSSTGTPVSYSLYVQNSPRTRSLSANTPINPWDAVTPPQPSPKIDPREGFFNGGYTFTGIPTNFAKSLFQIDYFLVNKTDVPQVGIFRSTLYKIVGGIGSGVEIARYDSPVVTGNILGVYTYNPSYDFNVSFEPGPSDYVYLTVELIAGPGITGGIKNWSWKIETLGIPVGSIFSPFWTTGSSNRNQITASSALTNVILGNYKQQDIAGSGFDPIQFANDIKIDDEIRFGYDESYTYKITDIQSTGSQYVYVLDRNLPSASYFNINQFTVRRKVKDYITGVALDANLTTPIEAGFILPEYPSQTLKQNLPNILNDLYGRTLI
jgi:hypothetical protein